MSDFISRILVPIDFSPHSIELPSELPHTLMVLRGQPARAIVEHAWTAEFDLIVMVLT
jgi:hypothetical protein